LRGSGKVQKRMNSCIVACFDRLGFRLLFERRIMYPCANVFLQKPFSAQSLVLGYVNEFVCQQLWIIRAVSASNDAVALTADKEGNLIWKGSFLARLRSRFCSPTRLSRSWTTPRP
jgi:hypothetical protein